jgi:hypothetical protein
MQERSVPAHDSLGKEGIHERPENQKGKGSRRRGGDRFRLMGFSRVILMSRALPGPGGGWTWSIFRGGAGSS